MADVRVVKGQQVGSDVWQRLSDQHGGTLPNPPNVSPDIDQAAPGVKAPEYTQRPIYRYIFEDGSYVDARTSPDGSGYEIVDYKPSDTFTADRRADEAAARKPSNTESVSAPANQPWIGERKPGSNEITWTKNPNYPWDEERKKKPSGQPYKNSQGQWVQRFEDGSTEVLPTEATPFEKPEAKRAPTQRTVNGKTYNVSFDDQGNEVVTESGLPAEQKEPPKPTIIDDPNRPGGKLAVIVDPSQPSGVRVEPVNLPSTARPGTAPTLPQGTHLGNISTAGQAVAQRIVDDPNMTPQEKINALDQLKGFLTTFTQETGQILGAQQNIYTNESNQRSLNVRDAESRRNFGAGLIQDAFKDVSSLKVPVGSNLGGPAFMSRVMMGLSLADKLGGLKVFPDVEMGAALQQTKGLGLPGMQQQPQAQPQQVQSGSGGQPINIFNVSQPPQSVQAALPPVPGGGFLPAGNDAGLRFEGGQIRAPGFRADDDTPAWMDEMVGAY